MLVRLIGLPKHTSPLTALQAPIPQDLAPKGCFIVQTVECASFVEEQPSAGQLAT